MAILRFIESLALIAVAILAIRRARPAASHPGSRMAWIGLLLALELGALMGFLALQTRSSWGIAGASPVGLAFTTQALRFALLVAALHAWLGLVRGELSRRWQLVLVALCALAFGWGVGGTPFVAGVVLAILLARLKWIENVSGWRRALAVVPAAALLAALSLFPVLTVSGGSAHLQFTPTPGFWPPPLLLGDVTARAASELALIRPLDRAVQAVTDLLRVQLFIVTAKLLFLPIRLAGTSLKRRFMINYILVRTVPGIMAFLLFLGLAYFVIGYIRLERVRSEFETTLARAGTVAEALAGDPAVTSGGADVRRLDAAKRWMGVDGERARVVVISPRRLDTAARSAPVRGSDNSLLPRDSAAVKGLVVTDDGLSLMARRSPREGTSIEVSVPLDSVYLDRIIRPIGGDLTLRAQPHVFVGASGIRVSGDSAWTDRAIVVRGLERHARGARGRRWYLGHSYLPVGDWGRTPMGTRVGAVEMELTTTPESLARTLLISIGGLYAVMLPLGILLGLGFMISMIEGFAVRSGRSIVQAVVDEAASLRAAAERFGRGELDYRLPVRGKDEFGVVAASLNDMAASLMRQRQELAAAERMEEDLAVARGIQQRFLPQQSPRVAGLDVAGVSLPSREVGGDLFYWFTHEDGSLGFTLGDVSGKSVPAALLMSNVLAALRAQAMLHVDLAESVARVNRFIVDQVEPGRFVTLVYGEVEPAGGTLRYASAGHNPPLLIRMDGRIEWLQEGGLPLGVKVDATYSASSIRFERGDTLIAYSDGVTEAMGPGGGFFGEDRLAAMALTQQGKGAKPTIDALLEAVRAFAAGAPQADDITIVVVRRV